jgi:hypothetical protein
MLHHRTSTDWLVVVVWFVSSALLAVAAANIFFR